MEERFSDKSVYQHFEAAIDRIDGKHRPPSPHEAGTLLRVLRTIKGGNFECAIELLSRLQLVVPAFASDVAGRVAGPVTTRHLRDRLKEIRIKASCGIASASTL